MATFSGELTSLIRSKTSFVTTTKSGMAPAIPKGLKGEAIPLVARIISVVDFYDATRCDRPYRKGMKREDSLALLRSMAGNAFDPRVVEKFIEHVEEFDSLIDAEDIQEQVASEIAEDDYLTNTKPDAGLASDVLGTPDDDAGFRSITRSATRGVCASRDRSDDWFVTEPQRHGHLWSRTSFGRSSRLTPASSL